MGKKFTVAHQLALLPRLNTQKKHFTIKLTRHACNSTPVTAKIFNISFLTFYV